MSPPRYRPKDLYTNKMVCQNSYKEAEIKNKLSAQSCRSQKRIDHKFYFPQPHSSVEAIGCISKCWIKRDISSDVQLGQGMFY